MTALYRYGSFAYVGGAFGKSLHNVLEPATFGMPIYFGNRRYQHVREATELVERGGAIPVADSRELRDKFLTYFRDEAARQKVADVTRQFVAENTGATDKIIRHVENQLRMDGLVMKSTGSWYQVLVGEDTYACRLRGKFKIKGLKVTNPIAVGDRVTVEPEDPQENHRSDHRHCCPARTTLSASRPARRYHGHIIAANLDQAVLVASLMFPRTSLGLSTGFWCRPSRFVFRRS